MPTERQLNIILESELEFKTFKEDPMTNNTQLPAEVLENIKKQAEVKHIARTGKFNPAYSRGYYDAEVNIATEYATKLHQEQQENESLTRQLKDQARVSDENMKLLKQENEKFRTLLERVMASESFPKLRDWNLFEDIKTFLDGAK